MGRFSLDGYTDKCVRMLNDMVNPKYVKADKQIPATLLRHCEGVAFITIFKAGLFFLGGNMGAGCVIVKVPDTSEPRGWRWSGPSAVVCGGLGGGFIFGAEKIDSMIILNTKSAVRAFMGGKQVTLGGNLSLAAGPVGRDMEAHVGASSNKEVVAAYSYSKAAGLYIGATLEGAFLTDKNANNRKYYQDETVTPARILQGEIRVPLKVDALHRELYMIHDRKGDYADLESSKQMSATPNSNSMQSTRSMDSNQSNNGIPPQWHKVFTADGKAYYHNVETNETSWEAPAPSPAPVIPVAAPAYTAPAAIPAKTSSPPSNPYSNPYSAPAAVPTSSVPPSSSVPPRPVPTRPGQVGRPPAVTQRPKVTALYDYAANRPDELSFKRNDALEVVDKSDANWWKCTSTAGQTGMVPSNYF